MRLPSIPVRILAAAAVLALGLVGLVVREGVARAQGQEIRLAITGYDPRSLLTGHYVEFRLLDTVPAEQVCRVVDREMKPLDGRWFAVRRAGSAHHIVAAAPSRAAALAKGDAAVRGTATCYGIVTTDDAGRQSAGSVTLSLDIGVDRIHLDQAEAETLEKALQGRDGPAPPSWAVLSVGQDGKARLKGLLVGDRRVDLTWF